MEGDLPFFVSMPPFTFSYYYDFVFKANGKKLFRFNPRLNF